LSYSDEFENVCIKPKYSSASRCISVHCASNAARFARSRCPYQMPFRLPSTAGAAMSSAYWAALASGAWPTSTGAARLCHQDATAPGFTAASRAANAASDVSAAAIWAAVIPARMLMNSSSVYTPSAEKASSKEP
jgi:hypothetical protein